MVDGFDSRDATYSHAGTDTSIRDFRAALEASRRAHMLLLQRAIASGYPACELVHDEDAAANAVEYLIQVCATQGVDAPMVLT